jgi:hypothetical protein
MVSRTLSEHKDASGCVHDLPYMPELERTARIWEESMVNGLGEIMKRSAFLAIVALTGCVPTPPVVSDFNGASVKVVDYAAGKTPENQAEASRVCKAGGKQRAEYASSSYNSNTYQSQHLYLCL